MMPSTICSHGIPVTAPCGHCISNGRIQELERDLVEAKQYLRECRRLLGHILPAGMADFLADSTAIKILEPK